jgi:Calcium binding
MAKAKSKHDPEREQRITMDIVVDAYDAQERAMGWYSYLQEQLQFPFTATCIARRAISPLHVKDEVEVISMPGEEECEHEMFVTIRWEKEGLAVPLSQLKPISVTDEQTKQAIEDWHYWVRMGYEF